MPVNSTVSIHYKFEFLPQLEEFILGQLGVKILKSNEGHFKTVEGEIVEPKPIPSGLDGLSFTIEPEDSRPYQMIRWHADKLIKRIRERADAVEMVRHNTVYMFQLYRLSH